MDRNEHLQWCKERAMEYIKADDVPQGIASFTSDMRKHTETANHPALTLGMQLIMNNLLNTVAKAEKFIMGFN